MHHASGTFALDFGLAPEHAQGQYQGLAGLGLGAGAAFAPIVMLGLCLRFGEAGWLGLGVFFALLGLTAPAIARWGARTRPNGPEQAPADPVTIRSAPPVAWDQVP
jgi:MFS family permease